MADTSLSELHLGNLEMLLPNATAAIQSELSKESFKAFIDNTYRLLDKVIGRIELHPIHREHDSEDRTTVEIVNALNFLGESWEHEASYGGNCDISSNFQNKYLWLGEAKIDYRNSHIMEGFRQLVDRYVAASTISREGALLIYCKDELPETVLAKWKKYFIHADNVTDEYSINIEDESERYFITSHYHRSSQKILRVKHMVISLFITATDKSAVKRKTCSHRCEQCCKEPRPEIISK